MWTLRMGNRKKKSREMSYYVIMTVFSSFCGYSCILYSSSMVCCVPCYQRWPCITIVYQNYTITVTLDTDIDCTNFACMFDHFPNEDVIINKAKHNILKSWVTSDWGLKCHQSEGFDMPVCCLLYFWLSISSIESLKNRSFHISCIFFHHFFLAAVIAAFGFEPL